MSCCPPEGKHGYEDCRFESDVEEYCHCCMCYNVLKEPRMCKNNGHVFCHDCITQHLQDKSQTCPECNEHLTVNSLRSPPRVLEDHLSTLKINCDYSSRGCSEFICVADLETHVANCGYAPVLCSNRECGIAVNKQEKIHHETVVCEYRKIEQYGFENIRVDVGSLKRKLVKLDGGLKETNQKLGNNPIEMKKIVGNLEGSVNKLDEKVEALSKRHDEMKQEIQKEVGEVKKEVRDLKENFSNMNKDVAEVKSMISQILEKLNTLEERSNPPTSPVAEMMMMPKPDILVAGGYCISYKTGKSTEIFSWEKNGWFEVSPMNDEHIGASSFIYKDQLFIVGGDGSKKLESLNLTELPLQWIKFPGALPYKCDDHQTVVYQQRIINIGGYISNKGRRSNVISELQLTSPCVMKELCQMPEPRDCHGAELFEDKLLILGGQKSHYCKDAMDSVLEFDAKTSKCKELSPLPHPLTEMGTVRWRDQVVMLGGRNKDGQVLSDVFMYDCKTGKTKALPSMLEKRYECCSVITGDTIVVMGGMNEDDECVSSVERFTMGRSTWEYLPAMSKARYRATANVLPSART